MSVSKRDVIRSLRQPKVAAMLMLGFSSGLPFFLTRQHPRLLDARRGHGAERDRLPVVGRARLLDQVSLGADRRSRRRAGDSGGSGGGAAGWCSPSCWSASASPPSPWSAAAPDSPPLGALALIVAFSSSTQDIVVDAWRIEAAADADELGLLSASYQFGYRLAMLVSEAAILILASHFGWRLSYAVDGRADGDRRQRQPVATEPLRAAKAFASKADAPLWTARGFFDAVIGPFTEFFRVYGWLALLMLAMISFYQLPEYMTGPMYNPFYHDLGLSKDAVGAVRASIGLVATLLGIAAGGFSALRFGYLPTLIAGVILKMLVIANFATLAHTGPDVGVFGAVIAADNFGIGFAGVALVTYMSSLTSIGYTATQYALLSSAYTYVGKFAKGFSGVIVERLAVGRPLIDAYGLFFIVAGLLGAARARPLHRPLASRAARRSPAPASAR